MNGSDANWRHHADYALAGFAMIGLCAGWLGGMLLKGCGLGLIGNLIVGVLGAFVGGVLVATFGLSAPGAVGSLFAAAIGAAFVVLI